MTNTKTIKIALAQTHVQVGIDESTINHNVNQLVDCYKSGNEQGCDLVIGPELSLTGYSLCDLMNRNDVQSLVSSAEVDLIEQVEIIKSANDTGLIFGNYSSFGDYKLVTDKILLSDYESLSGKVVDESLLLNYVTIVGLSESIPISRVVKKYLPNESVFDETRWFGRAIESSEPILVNGIRVGICICHDIWIEDTTRDLVNKGAQIIVVSNASPFVHGKEADRHSTIGGFAKKYNIPIVYVNMVSACDEVVFDGGSFSVDKNGDIITQLKYFEADMAISEIEIDPSDPPIIPSGKIALTASTEHLHCFDAGNAYDACVYGLNQFINAISNNSGHVVIGLSGGIDSALVATMAVDALGADRVHGVLIPSKFTSDDSNIFAEKFAKNIGISYETLSIEKMYIAASDTFGLDNLESIVSENVQSRMRGLTLMMYSNSRGWLPLATGNKSELAVGYCTLYGDTVGAYAPIKDLYKTEVFKVSNYRNSVDEYNLANPIPNEIIDREPTAELRPNQKDTDSLPSYETLDTILVSYIEHTKSIEEIIAMGHNEVNVNRIVKLIKNSEFKRKQSPVGTRLTHYNFGLGRRIPISAKW
ncbi:MAG: NAD+ synthase [Acidimicrobiia bacterium]